MSNKPLSEKEKEIQYALGTLPMKVFTITQSVPIAFELDVVQEVQATTREDALKEFKDTLNSTEGMIEIVEDKIRNMVDKYNYSRREDLTIPRAIAEARVGMKEDTILILKMVEVPEKKDK